MWQVDNGYHYNNDKGGKNLAAGFATQRFFNIIFPHIHFYAL